MPVSRLYKVYRKLYKKFKKTRKPLRRRLPRRAKLTARGTFKSRANKAIARSITYQQSKSCPIAFGEFTGISFNLASLLPASELTAWSELYDAYQIKGVKIQFVPKSNMNSIVDGSGTSAALIPEIMSAIDLNDSTAPPNVSTLLENGTFRRQRFNAPHSRYFKPRAQIQLFESSISTGYSLLPTTEWINMADSTVPHYGFKYIITPATVDATADALLYYDIYTTAYLAFKNKV